MGKQNLYLVLFFTSLILSGVLYVSCGSKSSPVAAAPDKTATPTATSLTVTVTFTLTNTATSTVTNTTTSTATKTQTATISNTPINSYTFTNTPTATCTNTATSTATNTATATASGSTPSWQLVGTAGFGAASAYTHMIFNQDNPYVVYADTGNGSKGMVEEYTSSAWATVGGADFTAGSAAYISPAFYNNNLYVAFSDNTVGSLLTVEEYNSGWTTIGTAGVGVACTYTSLGINSSGTIYAAITGVNYGYLMEYTGAGTSGWVTVGGGAFSDGTAAFVSLAFDASGNPYVAFLDGYNGGTSVEEYVSGSWTYLGGYKGSGNGGAGGGVTPNGQSLVNFGGNFYVGYEDQTNNDEDTVMEYGGSSWSAIGTAGFTPYSSSYTTLAFSPTNSNPYLSFSDGHDSSRPTVMEHTGAGTSGWVTVGAGDFSGSSTAYNSMAFDTSGDPWVAFQDQNVLNGNRVTVMEYH